MAKPFFEIFRETSSHLHFGLTPDNAFDAHYHSNIELMYVLDGQMEVSVRGQSKLLTTGQMSIADSYDIHSYRTPASSLSYVVIIPLEMVGSFSKQYEGKTFATPFLLETARTEQLRILLESLNQKREQNALATKGYLYVILALLAEELGMVSSTHAAGTLGPIRDILIYLDTHYLQQVKLSELAHHFGYNQDYLSRIFNASIGCGFKHYINLLRARHAAILLDSEDCSVTDICERSGFSSQRTFHRAFREIYDCTPMEYKHRIHIGYRPYA
jgi:AraC-like DNA-binding protein